MTKRLSLSLPEADDLRVQGFTREGPARDLLEQTVNRRGDRVDLASEAAVIRALIEVGARALDEELLEAGYAAMAADYAGDDDDRRAARRRHLDRSGDQP